MKKLLIGLLALGSISVFAGDYYSNAFEICSKNLKQINQQLNCEKDKFSKDLLLSSYNSLSNYCDSIQGKLDGYTDAIGISPGENIGYEGFDSGCNTSYK